MLNPNIVRLLKAVAEKIFDASVKLLEPSEAEGGGCISDGPLRVWSEKDQSRPKILTAAARQSARVIYRYRRTGL